MLFDGVCSTSSRHNSFETTLYGFDFCPGVVCGYFCLDVMTTWFLTPVLSVHCWSLSLICLVDLLFSAQIWKQNLFSQFISLFFFLGCGLLLLAEYFC
jgi:hypothetical protein